MKAEGNLLSLHVRREKASLREEHSKLMNSGAKRPNTSKEIVNKFKPKIRKGFFNNQNSEEATCNGALFSDSVLSHTTRNQSVS